MTRNRDIFILNFPLMSNYHNVNIVRRHFVHVISQVKYSYTLDLPIMHFDSHSRVAGPIYMPSFYAEQKSDLGHVSRQEKEERLERSYMFHFTAFSVPPSTGTDY